MAVRSLVVAILAVALAGCGGGSDGGAESGAAKLPGAGRPAVRLATKNFTEQYVVGQLYAQALRARGFTVELKQDVGSSELVDRALVAGRIDLYPEYTGVIVSELAHAAGRPRSAAETYRLAKAFEARRGFTLLAPSPGADALANAVLPAFARRHHLRTTDDLRRLGRFRYGGPPENRTRFQGLLGMQRAYGLRPRYVDLPIESRYRALDDGRVDVTEVFTTEGQLREQGRYVILRDTRGIFGFQHLAPVVARTVLRRQGPAFARTLDTVTTLLTDDALRELNGAVDLEHRDPADVARAFLLRHHLV